MNVSGLLLGITRLASCLLADDHSERGEFYQVIALVKAQECFINIFKIRMMTLSAENETRPSLMVQLKGKS